MQLLVKGAVCIINLLNPPADGLQALDFKRHKFSSFKLYPGCLQSRGMIGDFQRSKQEKFPAGQPLCIKNRVFDKDTEIPYKNEEWFLETG